MSYVRMNQDGSQVYIFGSQTHLQCVLAWWKAEELDIDQHYSVERGPNSPELMLDYCRKLQDKGVVVPDIAIDRLLSEIAIGDTWGDEPYPSS